MRIAILYTVVVLSWGFSWYAIELQLGDVPIETSISWRFLLASVVLFVILAMRGTLSPAPARVHAWLLLLGLTLFCMNFLAVYAATTYIPSGLVSVIFAFSAILTSINYWLFHRIRPTKRVLLGSVVGIGGLALVSSDNVSVTAGSEAFLGVVLAAVGAYSFSIGSIVSTKIRENIDIGSATAWAMLYGGIITGALSVFRNGSLQPGRSLDYVLSMTYLVVVGSIVAFLSYVTVVSRLGPSKAAFITVLFPIVAMATSTVLDDVQWSTRTVIGCVFVLTGLLVSIAPRSIRGGVTKLWRTLR